MNLKLMKRPKLIRITTVPQSLKGLLQGQLRYMSSHFELVGISSHGEMLNEVKIQEGVRVIPVTMSRQITPFKDLGAVWHLYKIFKAEKPLIVHTHTPKAGTLGMFAAKLAGVPIRLHTVAGMPLMEAIGKRRKLLDVVERLTYSCATKVYPNSKGLYNFILENRYTNSVKLKVLAQGSSNGIDTAHFNTHHISEKLKHDLKLELQIEPQDFVFVFVGRLVKDKGITELINAFKTLNRGKPNTKLLMVGSYETDLDPLLPETIREIENNKSIMAVGYQKDVRPYLAISDVLTFPSYREGFPNVVMQAGAMGLPCIVTDINGCNEIIEH
jgi:glycosyltransferase involved in cell wall biosynthesis